MGEFKKFLKEENKHVFFNNVGKYRLSVINRKWDTIEGTINGQESMIYDTSSKKICLMTDSDYSKQFADLTDENDVKSFLEDHKDEEY